MQMLFILMILYSNCVSCGNQTMSTIIVVLALCLLEFNLFFYWGKILFDREKKSCFLIFIEWLKLLPSCKFLSQSRWTTPFKKEIEGVQCAWLTACINVCIMIRVLPINQLKMPGSTWSHSFPSGFLWNVVELLYY